MGAALPPVGTAGGAGPRGGAGGHRGGERRGEGSEAFGRGGSALTWNDEVMALLNEEARDLCRRYRLMEADRDRMAAEREELRRMLRRCFWSWSLHQESGCPPGCGPDQ